MVANLSFRPGAPAGLLQWVAAGVLACAAGIAAAADVPESLAGVTVVTAEQAKKMVEAGVPIIDTRVGNEYADAHIRGARNVPYKEKSARDRNFDPKDDRFDVSKLPADKAAPVILYCNGPECWKSFKASKTAVAAGYRKVQWLRGGFPEWKGKGFPTE